MYNTFEEMFFALENMRTNINNICAGVCNNNNNTNPNRIHTEDSNSRNSSHQQHYPSYYSATTSDNIVSSNNRNPLSLQIPSLYNSVSQQFPRQTTPSIPSERTLGLQSRTTSLLNEILTSFLDSTVPIIATPEQIENATQTITYKDIENPLNTSCPILLSSFQPDEIITQIKECKHNFNKNSIATWFVSNVICPICRHDVRNSNIEEIEEEKKDDESSSNLEQPLSSVVFETTIYY
jgi:hypothetical protein